MSIFQDGPIEYAGDGVPDFDVKKTLNKIYGKQSKPVKTPPVPKEPKIAPVHTLSREDYLKRKAELEHRDGVEIEQRLLCPYCHRPM